MYLWREGEREREKERERESERSREGESERARDRERERARESVCEREDLLVAVVPANLDSITSIRSTGVPHS